MVSCKGRCPQPWYTPSTSDIIDVNQEKQQTPGRKQQQSQKKSGTWLSSKMEDSGEGDSPRRGQVKRNLRDIMDTMETLHTGASENVEVEKTPSLSEGDGTDPSAPQNDDEVEFNERNSREDSRDDNTLREEERSLEGSIKDRKERKKKSSADDDTIAPYVSHRPSECNIDKISVENGDIVKREDEDGDLASDVRREEDSVFSVSCEVNDGGERRKKKRRRVREDDEGAERSPSDAGVGSLNDEDVEIKRKKKKRKKEKSFVVTEEQEALDLSLYSPQRLTGQLDERAVSQETSQPVDVKNNQQSTGSCEDLTEPRKKRKKKRKLFFNEVVEEKGDVDVNPCGDDEAVSGQAVKKKKKKKEKEKSISHISEDAVAQSDDSVSVQEKEKERTASFFAADAVEKDAKTQQEKAAPWQSLNIYAWSGEKRVRACDFEAESAEIESADKVKEKKMKRKSSAAPGSGFKAGEQDFEKLRESALPEGSELPPNCSEIVGGVKRKKKSRRNEIELVTSVEGLDGAAGLGRGQSDEAVVLKKKRKSKGDPVSVIQDAESETSSLNNSSSVSHKKKRKKSSSSPLKLSHSAEICHDNSNTEEMVNTSVGAERASSSPTDSASNVVKVKKNKKRSDDVSPEESSNSVRSEPQTRKSKKKRDRSEQLDVLDATSESRSLSHQDTLSSTDNIKEDKRAKGERRHHSPSEDFTDI